MESNELLLQIRDRLRIPREDGTVHEPVQGIAREGEAWRALRVAIRELEESAARVGELPENYPMHLRPVMRVIHGLLPWYTRPLRQHAENTAAATRALQAVLEDLEARIPPPGKPGGKTSR